MKHTQASVVDSCQKYLMKIKVSYLDLLSCLQAIQGTEKQVELHGEEIDKPRVWVVV